MGKFLIYILSLIIYLGLSTNLKTTGGDHSTLLTTEDYPTISHLSPLEIILIGKGQSGLFIKSYHHKYKIVTASREPYVIVAKVSKLLWKMHEGHLGLTVFSRDEKTKEEGRTPTIPGLAFIGNLSYGYWEVQEDGTEVWEFSQSYQGSEDLDLHEELGHGKYRVTKQLFRLAETNQKEGTVFYGARQEFGPDGSVTNLWTEVKTPARRKRATFIEHLKKLFTLPKAKA